MKRRALDKVGKGKGRAAVNPRFWSCARTTCSSPTSASGSVEGGVSQSPALRCRSRPGVETGAWARSEGVVEKNVQDSSRRIWLAAGKRRFGTLAELNAWLAKGCHALWQEIRHPSTPA